MPTQFEQGDDNAKNLGLEAKLRDPLDRDQFIETPDITIGDLSEAVPHDNLYDLPTDERVMLADEERLRQAVEMRPDGSLNGESQRSYAIDGVTTQDFIEMNRGIRGRIDKLKADIEAGGENDPLNKHRAEIIKGLEQELDPHRKPAAQAPEKPDEAEPEKIAA